MHGVGLTLRSEGEPALREHLKHRVVRWQDVGDQLPEPGALGNPGEMAHQGRTDYARQAEHRPRNAVEVGSSPTAGSCYSTTSDRTAPAVGCNPTLTQVRLLPASLISSGVAQTVRASPRKGEGRWLDPSRRNCRTGVASGPADRS